MSKTFFLALSATLALTNLEAHNDQAPISRSEILKNPDIVWAGEGLFTYLLDERNLEKINNKDYTATLGIDGRFGLMILKDMLDRNDARFQDARKDASDMDLIHTLIQDDFLGSSEIYADAHFKTKYSAKEAQSKVHSIDTIIADGNKKLVVNQLDPRDVIGYQVRQIVYFDKKTNSFGNVIEALAPLQNLYDGIGNKTGTAPLFWIKVSSLQAIPDLNSSSIFWARRSICQIPFDKLTDIKSSKNAADCMQAFFDNIVKNYKTENLLGVFEMEKMPVEEMKNILVSVDTIITFDPNTFQEIAQVKTNTVVPKDVKKLRFFVEWAWDKNKRTMGCYTTMFAPISRRLDDNGNFLMEGPVFFKPL